MLIMDYKMINPNGSPFSLQETKDAKQSEQSQQVSSKLINMILSLFQ